MSLSNGRKAPNKTVKITDVKNDIDIEKIMLIAREAGDKIMDVYKNEDLFVEKKKDSSPITLADRLSHSLITEKLKACHPDIPSCRRKRA